MMAIVTHGIISRYLGLEGYGHFMLFIGLSFVATQIGDLGASMIGSQEVSLDRDQGRIIQQIRFVGYVVAMIVYSIVSIGYGIKSLNFGVIAIIAFFGITDWALRGQGRPHIAALRQVLQGMLQVTALTLVSLYADSYHLAWAIVGFGGATLLSTLVTWRTSYAVLTVSSGKGNGGAWKNASKHLQTLKRLVPGHLGVLLLHAQYQIPVLALPLVAAPAEAGRYGAAYVIFAGLSSAVTITQDIFLPKGSSRRPYFAWQIASAGLPIIILLLLPLYGQAVFGAEFVLSRELSWGFAALMLAYGLRFLSIQMRLFRRQYDAFAELNLWGVVLQALVWFFLLSENIEITAEHAVLTLAGAETIVAFWAWLRPTPQQGMAAGLLTYNGNPRLVKSWKRWARRGVSDVAIVVDTGDKPLPEAISVSNEHYEFGGYLELAKRLGEIHDGPYFIANDRLFYKRFCHGWTWLLRRRDLFDTGCYVMGDVHDEKIEAPELNNPYLSSWIFYIPDRWTLNKFIEACEKLIATPFDKTRESQAYREFMERWLNGPQRSRYRGNRQPNALARKARTIRMEHALSAHLIGHGVFIRRMPGYSWIFRGMDKVINRIR